MNSDSDTLPEYAGPPMTPSQEAKVWRDWFAASGGAEWDKVDDIEAELGRAEP